MSLQSDPTGRQPEDARDWASLWLLSRRSFIGSITSGSGDPRVGSGRQNSTGGTLSTTTENKSNSLKNLGATFVPISVILGACLLIFLVLRPRLKRVYAPRTIPALRVPERASPELPRGHFSWLKPFLKTQATFVLNNGSLDGFLLLRYLKVLRNMCLVGCAVTWPVLLPLHATGGNGCTELEMLTMANVKNPQKFYTHVFISWIYFGFVLYSIVRECIYYVNLRQAYLSSPLHADRLSSRTLMLTSVPARYLDERRLRKIYGDTVRRIWIPRTSKALSNMVKEREQTAERLEKAEIELIKKANAARVKALRSRGSAAGQEERLRASSQTGLATEERNNHLQQDNQQQSNTASEVASVSRPGSGSVHGMVDGALDQAHGEKKLCGTAAPHSPERENPDRNDLVPADSAASVSAAAAASSDASDAAYVHPYGLDPKLPDVRGSVAAQWIKAESRPRHRPIGNFGRRVDTIRWCRMRLKDLNQNIHKMRRRVRRGDAGSPISAAFVEFESQKAAQAAHQVVAHHRPLQMSPRLLGVRPDEVIWSSLRMNWWELIGRRFSVLCLITAAVIFWSIPSAFVAIIANISFLEKIPFLVWIKDLPGAILGFLQGFVPALALSLVMALVPFMVRACARTAGVPSLVLVELFCQHAYFAFQVVQVFLITTLTQAASGSLIDILENPLGARLLLAKNLPQASNFYLSYILIQCLGKGSLGMVHIFDLIRHQLLPRITAIPRVRLKAWLRLRLVHYGAVFPVFSNMFVIAICYACIAPLVLGFAALGIWFTYFVWKYNLTYVFGSQMDSKGLFYPRALQHLTIGLYLAELCLVGLFGLNTAYGPMALEALFLVFTGLVHMSLRDAIAPLLQNLPQTLQLEEEIQEEEKEAARLETDDRAAGDLNAAGAAASYYDAEEVFGEGDREQQEDSSSDEENDGWGSEDGRGPEARDRALEGATDVRSTLTAFLKASALSKAQTEVEELGISHALSRLGLWSRGDRAGLGASPPSFLTQWLHPELYEDFVALRKTMLTPENVPQESSEEPAAAVRGRISYMPPEMWAPKPRLWIPEDDARVSRQEVAHTRLVTPIYDKAAFLDEKGRVFVDLDAAPIREPRLLL